MRKVKSIADETYQGKHKSENGFKVVCLSTLTHWLKKKPKYN